MFFRGHYNFSDNATMQSGQKTCCIVTCREQRALSRAQRCCFDSLLFSLYIIKKYEYYTQTLQRAVVEWAQNDRLVLNLKKYIHIRVYCMYSSQIAFIAQSIKHFIETEKVYCFSKTVWEVGGGYCPCLQIARPGFESRPEGRGLPTVWSEGRQISL